MAKHRTEYYKATGWKNTHIHSTLYQYEVNFRPSRELIIHDIRPNKWIYAVLWFNVVTNQDKNHEMYNQQML